MTPLFGSHEVLVQQDVASVCITVDSSRGPSPKLASLQKSLAEAVMSFSGLSRGLARAVAVSTLVLGCRETSAPPPVTDISTISISPTSAVIRGRDTIRVFVTLRDSSGGLIKSRLPAVTPRVQGVAVVERTSVRPAMYYDYTMEFVLRSVAPGQVTFSVTIEGKHAEFPVAVRFGGPDSGYVNSGGRATFGAIANDLGSPVRITGLVPPRNGTASIASTTDIDYTSTAGYVGLDSLAYIAVDPAGRRDTVPVRVHVMPGPYRMTPVVSTSVGIGHPIDLSQTGEVSGTLTSGSTKRAFRWSTSRYIELPVASPSDNSTASAINDLGDVVGEAGGWAVLWPADATAPLNLVPTDAHGVPAPVDMNNRQEIVFSNMTVWRNARIDTIAVLTNMHCKRPAAINDRGDVLADFCGDLYYFWSVALAAGGYWAAGSCYGARQSAAMALNQLGWVLGRDEPALYLKNSSCIRLSEVYDHAFVAANGLNNRGWIVGETQSPSDTTGVLLVNGATIPLDKLAPDHGAWHFVSGHRVNDAGQILAWGKDINTQQRAWFLLSPPSATQSQDDPDRS
jgi:hypothetical protein